MLLTVGLPLSLAFIMLSLGLGLKPADFARIARRPKAMLMGFVAQVIFLPLIAYLMLSVVSLPGGLALGVMILAFCPGGVTTSLLTRMARGDVALSVSLTAVVSLISVLTVPPLVAISEQAFVGAVESQVNIARLGISMALITAVPVILGMVLRGLMPGFASKAEPVAYRISSALFVVIIVAALAANWSPFQENFAMLAPILVALNVILLILGFGLARLIGLTSSESRAIAIEAGVQNGTLGIAVAGLIAGAGGLGAEALPSAVYGITMYVVTLPLILWWGRHPATD